MSFPSAVLTHHLQARPRFFKTTSKTGNCSGIVGLLVDGFCCFLSIHFVAGSNLPTAKVVNTAQITGGQWGLNFPHPQSANDWRPLASINSLKLETFRYVLFVSVFPINPVAL